MRLLIYWFNNPGSSRVQYLSRTCQVSGHSGTPAPKLISTHSASMFPRRRSGCRRRSARTSTPSESVNGKPFFPGWRRRSPVLCGNAESSVCIVLSGLPLVQVEGMIAGSGTPAPDPADLLRVIWSGNDWCRTRGYRLLRVPGVQRLLHDFALLPFRTGTLGRLHDTRAAILRGGHAIDGIHPAQAMRCQSDRIVGQVAPQ